MGILGKFGKLSAGLQPGVLGPVSSLLLQRGRPPMGQPTAPMPGSGGGIMSAIASRMRPKMMPPGGFAGPLSKPNPMGGGMDPLGQANTIRAMMQMMKKGRR